MKSSSQLGSQSALRKFATRENRSGTVDSWKAFIPTFNVSIHPASFDLKYSFSGAFEVFVPGGNYYQIIAQKHRMILRINGVTASELIDNEEGHYDLKGILGLQLHTGNR